MRYIYIWLTVVASVLLITSCSKTEIIDSEGRTLPEIDGYTKVTITSGPKSPDSQTRLEVKTDATHGLKTSWTVSTTGDKSSVTDGDMIRYCYTDGNNEKHYVYLTCVRYSKDHSGKHQYAEFEGYIPSEEEGQGLVNYFYDKDHFVAAVVLPAGARDIIGFDGEKIQIRQLDKQDGTVSNLRKYDLLYTNKKIEGKYNNQSGITLHFQHSRFAYLHLPFKSEVMKGQKVDRIYFNHYPAVQSGGEKADNAFLKTECVSGWNTDSGLKSDESREYNMASYRLDSPQGSSYINLPEVNVLAIENTPLQFDDKGNLDVYLAVSSGYLAGRISVQVKTKNTIASNTFYVKTAMDNNKVNEYGVVFESAKDGQGRKKIMLDNNGQVRDNAIGMFLFCNGNYSPIPGKDITNPTAKVKVIGVCTSNKTVKVHKKNDYFSDPHMTCDGDYAHYAMSLMSADIDQYAETAIGKEKPFLDEVIFPRTDIFEKICVATDNKDRYGMQNTLIFEYAQVGTLPNGGGCINVLNKVEKRINIETDNISKMFIPSSGQLYQLLTMVPVIMKDKQLVMPKYVENNDKVNGVYLVDKKPMKFILKGQDYRNSVAHMFNYYGVREKGDPDKICTSSTQFYAPNYGDAGSVLCFQMSPKYRLTDFSPEKYQLIPFYAFKSMTTTVDDDWCQIMEWKKISGFDLEGDQSNIKFEY